MKKISKGQIFALNKLISSLTKESSRELRLYIISKILNKEVESTKNLSFEDWRKVRGEAYDDWWNDNWNPTEEFKEKVSDLENKYLEEIKGYQKLNF